MERILPAPGPFSPITMARRVLEIVLLLLIMLSVAATGSGLVAAQTAPPSDGPATWIAVDIDASGDADWAIETRFDVSTAERRAAFETLVDDVRSGDVDMPYDREMVEGYRDRGAAAVDRSMAIESVSWEDRIEDDVGVLAFRFTWTNFAAVEGDRLVIGDAFHGPEGAWLGALNADTWLTVSGPPDYAVVSSPPDQRVEDGAVTWEGPTSFEPGDFAMTLEAPESGAQLETLDAVLLALGALVFGAVLVAWYRHERQATAADEAADADDEGESGEPPEDDGPDEQPPEDSLDPELLSDPERVERLLEEHGGRMKQAMIVEETDWSTAKVSQLLSSMAEEGRIEKLRIGQENLISLPDEDET